MAKRNRIFYRSEFWIDSELALSFTDRIRILFGGKIAVRTDIASEKECGHVLSKTTLLIHNAHLQKLQNFFSKFRRKEIVENNL